MTTTNTLATLFGKIAKPLLPKRGQQPKLRFLCPNCLHFGDFAFACGECWAELPGYANRKNTRICRCKRSLRSSEGDGVRAYCKRCKANYDRSIYHQRQVRVIATLLADDSLSLYKTISGQESQPQGGRGYLYDDGTRLTYILDLSTVTEASRSLLRTDAFGEMEFIWLDSEANTSLELVEAADRFLRQANLTKKQQHALMVCVPQDIIEPAARIWLAAHFGTVKQGVAAADFLSGKAQTKVVAQGQIGDAAAVPALIENR